MDEYSGIDSILDPSWINFTTSSPPDDPQVLVQYFLLSDRVK